jgi:hypothetical protein
MPGNHNRGRSVSRRQSADSAGWPTIDGNNRVRRNPASARRRIPADGPTPPRRTRNQRRTITARNIADVDAVTTAAAPPPRAFVYPRSPSPAKAVIPVPHAALVWHVAPGITRHPHIAGARRPHPVAVAVGIPSRAGRIIRRPDISLAGHVIPASIRVQIVPRRIAVV